ncbi:transporter associated domain-containing protein [Rhodobaculum claviforme]|uniref:Magnesium/cobalt efflux protein n=1 Tax=Rhodobaculum claviforme TaxID=1549854 RepID=A0A934WIX3_9RHOB|nr:transporter associated domain-containing protein [Rhodobaculum claviforme]MBK5927421.1 magnesium/cobalt efflux protein [Rhodobaculum claviforme]
MGDTDGGSRAARSAPNPQTDSIDDNGSRDRPGQTQTHDRDDSAQRGLLGRLIGAFATPDEGEIDRREDAQILALGLARLRRLRLEDVAVPKAEIVAVPVDISRADLIASFRESGFSRVPVYDETLDRPLGLLLLKDLALRYGFNGHHDFDLRPLLRPLIYAPPSMPAAKLMQRMQAERTHMALVIDEYGGVDGLVTIEDLIEQVVGEIEDEHDTDDERPWLREDEGVWLMQARTPLEEVEAEIGVVLVEDDARAEVDTLGGLVAMLAGRVPARGEVIVHPDGVEFEIVDADPRRLNRVRLRLTSPHSPRG